TVVRAVAQVGLETVPQVEMKAAPREGVFLGPEEKQAIDRFNDRYHLLANPADAERLAQTLRPEVLGMLATTTGWTLESTGSHLGFWKRGHIVPAEDRQ